MSDSVYWYRDSLNADWVYEWNGSVMWDSRPKFCSSWCRCEEIRGSRIVYSERHLPPGVSGDFPIDREQT